MIALDTSEQPVVSIQILCQDNLELLGDCLASIARNVEGKKTPYEVMVLFQQTSPHSVASFLSDMQGVRQLHARLNLGFGGGNNYAAKHARGKYLVFLNDDTVTQPGWLEALVHTIERDERIGAVGSRILFPEGTVQEAGVIVWSDGSCHPLGRGAKPGSLDYSYVRDVAYASANGLIVRRETFEAAGGFDTRFYPGYYEDVDLCMTIRHKLGLRIVYEPRSIILHRESATANRDPDFRTFLFRRHQAGLCAKWPAELATYPAAQPESPAAVEAAVMHARGNPKRVLVVDDRVPQIGMGSGSGRIADMLEDLTAAGYAVAICPTDRGRMPSQNTVGALGVDLVTEPLFEHLKRPEKRYDAVIISRPHNYRGFAAAVRYALPSAALIYDVEALYHRRLLMQARLEADSSRRNRRQSEADTMMELEIGIARSADRLAAISESEYDWLASIGGHAPIDFMRPLANSVTPTPAALQERSGGVFVAGWLAGDASPNVDALRWYATEIVPRVRAVLPDFVTYVSGANPPVSVQKLECPQLVLVGLIRSVESLYRSARIAVAPILAGAGVKIKTIEALQHGVPVVATAVGAEGLGLNDAQEIDVTDDPDEYARRVIALATDDALWLRRRDKVCDKLKQWESGRIRWGEVVGKALHDREPARTLTSW